MQSSSARVEVILKMMRQDTFLSAMGTGVTTGQAVGERCPLLHGPTMAGADTQFKVVLGHMDLLVTGISNPVSIR